MLGGRGAPWRAARARVALAAAVAVAWLAPAPTSAADERPPDVLVLQSYHRGFTWDDEQLDGLLAGFRARWPSFEPHVLHLDAKRQGGPSHEAAVLALLSARRPLRPYDAIVATDDAAFAFVLRHRAALGADTPVAFCGVNGVDAQRAAALPRVSGVIERVDVAGTVELIRALQPSLRTLVVLLDETDTSGALRAQLLEELRGAGAPALRIESGRSLAEAEALAAALGPDDALLLGSFVRDRLGVMRSYEEVAERISERSGAPVYGLWAFQLGRGIVGGSLLSGRVQGHRAAEVALALLDGRTPPVDRGPGPVRAADAAAAARFGLDLARLGPGLEVVNAPETLWSTHRAALLAAAAAFVVLAALAAVLLAVNRRLAGALEALRRAEADRERLRRRLEETQRVEAVGRLAGGIAHDLNNLLTPVLACASIAREQLGPGHDAAADLDTVISSAERARDLTRQVLAFSRRQRLELRDLDLAVEVEALRPMLGRLLGEDVEVRFALATGPLPVRGDPGQLQQVVMNLVVNARDAMPRGGILEIATSRRGNSAVLAVRDTGTGMSEEVRRHLFEPFFTTKEVGKGTGLGLSTVHGIVKQHGGELEVESEEGRGSTFRVVLPLGEVRTATATTATATATATPTSTSTSTSTATATSATATATATRPAPPTPSRTILLVEDELLVRRLARRVLAGAGYRVVDASNGAAALDAAASLGGALDLLLTDVVMPGLTGRELRDRILALHPGLPVLFMSGYPALPGSGEAVVAAAGEPLLAKPFTAEELLARVEETLAAASGGAAAPSPR